MLRWKVGERSLVDLGCVTRATKAKLTRRLEDLYWREA